MDNLQDIFAKLQEMRKEQKEIKKEYRDALSHDVGYTEMVEKMKQLRDEKKKFEQFVQDQMGQRYVRLDELKDEVADTQQMLSDLAITTLMKGEAITIKDEYDNLYEPNYTVSFKKSGVKDTEMPPQSSQNG